MVKRYRYFLNENYTPGDALMLEAHAVSRDREGRNALIVSIMIPILDKYVRSHQNPKGILDWEGIDIAQNPPKVIESSYEYFTMPITKMTFESLMGKKREDLIKLAKAFGISGANLKSDDFLRRRIFDESEKLETVKTVEVQEVAEQPSITPAIEPVTDASEIEEGATPAPVAKTKKRKDTTEVDVEDVTPVMAPNTPE